MTAVAFLLLVNAMQRESCQIMIKEHRILPGHLRVAALALRAQHSLVRIVIQVTRLTVWYQLDVENWFDVAVITGDFDCLVSTQKFVIRLDVVIEEGFGPICAGMAGIAPIAAMRVMRVIVKMAGRACPVHRVFKRIL